MSAPTRPVRLLAAALLTGGLTLAGAPAFAHVRVVAPDATQGGFAVLTVRVPTESDTASTTKVQVAFPADQPLAFVSVKPHAGWSYKVVKATLEQPVQTEFGEISEAVSTITWTADGAGTGIKPGEFDEFQISAGPLPEADEMSFKAVQTYSDGEVVRWIEPTPAGGEEPEHPAPVLALAAAATDEEADASPSADVSPSVTATAADIAADDDGGGSALPTVLAGLALVVALGAAGLALTARRRA